MQKILGAVLALCLPLAMGGCGAVLAYGIAASVPATVGSGNENGATVRIGAEPSREPEALAVATQHSGQFEKTPREQSRTGTLTVTYITYSCIRPGT